MKEIKNFDEFKQTISEGVVLIDFFATWCGPCRMLEPELKKIESVPVAKVDIDHLVEAVREYEILSVPTLMLFKDGKVVDQISGYLPAERIEEWIKSKLN